MVLDKWTCLSSALLPVSKSVKGLFGVLSSRCILELDDMCVRCAIDFHISNVNCQALHLFK